MTTMNSTFEIRRPAAGVAVIDIRGDITPESEAPLMESYGQATTDAPRAVILNFGGLDYMNSGGIGLLVTLLVRAQRSKQRLYAYGLSDHYQQILSLTRLDEAIGIQPSEEAALAAARS
jgi:anti-sigma B factor antagonist